MTAGGLHTALFDDAEIAAYLSPEAEIAAMIRFEAALAVVEARLGIVPAEAGDAIARALADVEIAPAELTEGVLSAGVAVPALVARLRAAVGPPHGGFLHWGATSQDVVDTGLVLRLLPVLEILDARLSRLVARLMAEAEAHARLPMAARTRSQIAVPTTLGLRIAGWTAPLARMRDRLAELRPRLLVVQFGGAAGTLSVLGTQGPAAMDALAAELGLASPAKPWHAERDTMAELGHWLAALSALLGRIGGDLILMGRSESAEMRAGTGGGSSTMPQKANPVAAETLVALARFNAAQAGGMLDALLHQEERDSTLWSAEWALLPPMLAATGAGLARALDLAETLRPDPDRMAGMLEIGGGAAEAETLAFALARHMPLPEAQALVKTASRSVAAKGGTLREHLAPLCAARGVALPDPGLETTLETAEALIARLRARIGGG